VTRPELTTERGLVHRYEGEDGLPGGEGAFILCSFWLVDCLALSGDVEEAGTLFENILELVSPLGFLSEEVVPETGELLENYPQALSHLGPINSAIYICTAQAEDKVGIYYPAVDAQM
jgi:GH15 family glucan-1,4-alpha-glucosidase